MYAVIFVDRHDETGADHIAITPVEKEPEPAQSIRSGGKTWTAMGAYMTKDDAEKRAKSLVIKNNNYSRGFGPVPVKYVGIVARD